MVGRVERCLFIPYFSAYDLQQAEDQNHTPRLDPGTSIQRIDLIMDELQEMGLSSKQIAQTGRVAALLNTQGWRTDQVAEQIQELINEGKLQGVTGEQFQINMQQLLRQMMGEKYATNYAVADGNSKLSLIPPQGAGIPEGNPPQAASSPNGIGEQSVTPTDETLLHGEFSPIFQKQIKETSSSPPGVRPRVWPGLEVTGLPLRMAADGRLSIAARARVNALIETFGKQFGNRQIFANVYKTPKNNLLLHVTSGMPFSDKYYSCLGTVYRIQTEDLRRPKAALRDVEAGDRTYPTEDETIDWWNNEMADLGIYDVS